MRLLNVETLQLELFLNEETMPAYTILSHCWGEEEVSFQDMQSGHYRHLRGFKKLAAFCLRSALEQYKYAWMDTCCIDKTSSSELSEAINSMFRWYEQASVCYAYLEDVQWNWKEETWEPHDEEEGESDSDDEAYAGQKYISGTYNVEALRLSRWFSRGWTLQELIAPNLVIFFDREWKEIGTKTSMAGLISDITGIDKDMLSYVLKRPHPDGVRSQLRKYPVATRMAWASARETTRPEDKAYCLFGVFNVNMPLIYGEGEKAFFRLQQEIIRELPDASILLWEDDGLSKAATREFQGVLAPSPKNFKKCRDVRLPEPATAGQYSVHNASTNAPVTPAMQPGASSSTVTLRAQFFSLEELLAHPSIWPEEYKAWSTSQAMRAMCSEHSVWSLMNGASVVKPGAENNTPSKHGEKTDDGDGPDSNRMKYYIAILSRTRNSGPLGILLEQLPNGTFVRAKKHMAIWQFKREFTRPQTGLFIPRRARSLTMMARTTLLQHSYISISRPELRLIEDVHVNYVRPRARWGSHESTSRGFLRRSPAYFALFRSKVPDVLPTFAVVSVGSRREVGCCIIPVDPRDGGGPGQERLGRFLPQITTMPVKREMMRMTLVPGKYEVVVSLRMHAHVDGPDEHQLIVSMEPREGSDQRRVAIHLESREPPCEWM